MKTTKAMRSEQNGGRKRSVLERFKDFFRSPKKSRPQPLRQYTYPRGDPVSRRLFTNPPSTLATDETFHQKYDNASDADRNSFLKWKKAPKNYNKALAKSRQHKRVLQNEKAFEQRELAQLKAEVMRCYGRLDSKALVEAYKRLPEEQASYEAFLKEYAALNQHVNHAELHARIGPAYIHSPSFGRQKTPQGEKAPSAEVIARAKTALERGNKERDERERQAEAERTENRYKSTRNLTEYVPKANEKRKVITGPSTHLVGRKALPEGVTGGVETSVTAPKQYQAYKPARRQPEPDTFSNRDLPVNNPEAEKRRVVYGSDGRYDALAKPPCSSRKLASSHGGYDPIAYVSSVEHHPDSYRERERRLRTTRPRGSSRHPTHYMGRELDYSHHESSSSSDTSLHPAYRDAGVPQGSKRKGGTYLGEGPRKFAEQGSDAGSSRSRSQRPSRTERNGSQASWVQYF